MYLARQNFVSSSARQRSMVGFYEHPWILSKLTEKLDPNLKFHAMKMKKEVQR